jgi:hypothetical protein
MHDGLHVVLAVLLRRGEMHVATGLNISRIVRCVKTIVRTTPMRTAPMPSKIHVIEVEFTASTHNIRLGQTTRETSFSDIPPIPGDDNVNIPADHLGRKTTREVRPYDPAAKLFCARPAEADFTYSQTGTRAWPGAPKLDGIIRRRLERNGHMGNSG